MTHTASTAPPVHHRTAVVRGLTVAYREAGDPASPTVVLLHGSRPRRTCSAASSRTWPVPGM